MSLSEKIKHEMQEIGKLTLFFFLGFLIILLILKLLLLNYDIKLYVISKALLGAIITAKVLFILKNRSYLLKFKHHPGYVNILFKTFVYDIFLLLILFIEKVIEALREKQPIDNLFHHLYETRETHHILAITLIVSLLFIIYNTLEEIDRNIGEKNLYNILFEKKTSSF